MEDWKPKLKHYPHFDAPLPLRKIMDIVKDPESVAKNSFYPFLKYVDVQQRFGQSPKKRPIRYAARRDSYIFSYYRHLLSQKYEPKLKETGLDECIIAYRKISISKKSEGGKCNIHFAKEAFEEIKRREDCYAVALDISSYFDNIDHEKLESIWSSFLEVDTLPSDHAHVFRNITDYAEVDFDVACERLGYKEWGEIQGVKKFGYKREISKKDFFTDKKYKQLCTPQEFRTQIADFITKNPNSYGIPQGSPISDILANMYLYPFDLQVLQYASDKGVYYRRYSDDLLLIIPRDESLLKEIITFIKSKIKEAGDNLEIKDKKTLIKDFSTSGGQLACKSVYVEGLAKQHKGDSFEYLGFAFDGASVRIKDSTMHRFNRKIIYGARHYAAKLVVRYEGKTPREIMELANFSHLYQKYGRIKDYQKLDLSQLEDKKKLTFLAYAKKADKIMSDLNSKVMFQLKRHKQQIRDACNSEIIKQFAKRKSKAV